ncbi:unnamed protein product, partial [Urochloa humidicola]
RHFPPPLVNPLLTPDSLRGAGPRRHLTPPALHPSTAPFQIPPPPSPLPGVSSPLPPRSGGGGPAPSPFSLGFAMGSRWTGRGRSRGRAVAARAFSSSTCAGDVAALALAADHPRAQVAASVLVHEKRKKDGRQGMDRSKGGIKMP